MGTKFLFIALLLLSLKADGQWFNQNINTASPLSGLQFLSSNTGWVLGSNISSITFYKTTDGGNSWSNMFDMNGPLLSKLFLNSGMGWLTYEDYPSGAIMVTTYDGGVTFSAPIYLGFYFFRELIFFDDSNGLGAGSVGAPQYASICRTTDGGSSWSQIYSNYNMPYFSSLSFLDNQKGWCAGLMASPYIVKTTDGGNTWNPFPSGTLNEIKDIQFFNDISGWVQNNESLYLTTDGGLNWAQKASNITRFWFYNISTGWYVSADKIYYTTNAGNSWTLQYSNPGKTLNDVFFINSEIGWACGNDGLLLHTTNGGTPVELVSFTAEYNNDAVYLNWITATETNNKGFEIERTSPLQDFPSPSKGEGKEWRVIGFVQGNGTTTEQTSYSFKDAELNYGTYKYRLKQIDYDGSYEYSETVKVTVGLPEEYELMQNYPNPFNPTTRIKYSIAEEGLVNLSVYNLLGQKISELENDVLQPGNYESEFNASSLSSGVYVYKLIAGGRVLSRKMVVLK